MSDLQVGVVVAAVSMGGTLIALGVVGLVTVILGRILPAREEVP